VILALAILCGAVATLGELSRLGMRSAERARDVTQAQLLCESKMAEITAGLASAESDEDVPLSESEDETETEWLYSVEATPLDQQGLMEIRVTVTKNLPAEQHPAESSLVRWMVDESAVSSEESVSQ